MSPFFFLSFFFSFGLVETINPNRHVHTFFSLFFFSSFSLWGKGKDSLDNTTKGKKRLLFDALCVVSTPTPTPTPLKSHTQNTHAGEEKKRLFF